MRVLGLGLATALALSTPTLAQTMPNGFAGDWHRPPGPSRTPVPNNPPSSRWVCCSAATGPSYWIYVPGSAVFDYPFPDWRGPTGGWGNP
jgi:hypothetical protein